MQNPKNIVKSFCELPFSPSKSLFLYNHYHHLSSLISGKKEEKKYFYDIREKGREKIFLWHLSVN